MTPWSLWVKFQETVTNRSLIALRKAEVTSVLMARFEVTCYKHSQISTKWIKETAEEYLITENSVGETPVFDRNL